MAHASSATARELDDLIAEITMDSNGEDEALSGFEVAFENDVRFPLSGTVVDEEVQVLSVGLGHGRRELIATCDRAGQRYRVAVLDVDLAGNDNATRLVDAYRRWLGSAHDGAKTRQVRPPPSRAADTVCTHGRSCEGDRGSPAHRVPGTAIFLAIRYGEITSERDDQGYDWVDPDEVATLGVQQ